MTSAKPDINLDTIRREIDEIDRELLALVLKRFEATARVRAAKKHDGSIAASPLRPAREAQMLRKLARRASGSVTPQFLVRLWRLILSASTQAQAPVTLQVHAAVAGSMAHRLTLNEHFCGMSIEAHANLTSVFAALNAQKGDLAIMETISPWADHFAPAHENGIQLIASLPAISTAAPPGLLVFGHAEAQPSGDDETLLLARAYPRPTGNAGIRWQAKSGAWTLLSHGGFLSAEAASDLVPGCIIAGRLPRPIEVTT